VKEVRIDGKDSLVAYLDTCEILQELRDAEAEEGDKGEWPEFRSEIVKLCFDRKYLMDALGIDPPPALNQDWAAWLDENLDDIADEAFSIVM
jgi:hypothetical protein